MMTMTKKCGKKKKIRVDGTGKEAETQDNDGNTRTEREGDMVLRIRSLKGYS